MKRRRSLVIILVATLITGLVALVLWRSEPRYGGRSLTDWAIQGQDYENLALTDKPDYLAASNAIHQMGPAAAKTAVDWLNSEVTWKKSALRLWIEKLAPRSGDIPRIQREVAAVMILRLGSEEAQLSVEPKLIAMLENGRDEWLYKLNGHIGRIGVLTNFSAATWSRLEPLLLHTNHMVRLRTLELAISWNTPPKLNLGILWQCRSKVTDLFTEARLDELLLRHGAETNRLAEAIGSSFLNSANSAQEPMQFIEYRAKQLSALGQTGSRYFVAGLTNGSEAVRIISRRYLYR